jgi:hypothetical protein
MVVEAEIQKLNRFQEFLRQEDRAVFEDMMNQCKLYASYASCMASPIRAIPILTSIIFAQHKKIMQLEKRINRLPEARADQKGLELFQETH